MPTVNDPRLELELFAREPQIVTPTGIEVDAQGRVYVLENLTHFRPDDYVGPEKDRIRVMRDTDGDGRADAIHTFYEGMTFGTDLAFGADGWLYVTTRASVFRLRDGNDDGRADTVENLVRLVTTGVYPHNGISGLAFDAEGALYFGFGENLGRPYKMIGADGNTFSGEAEGGSVYHMRPDGTGLRRVATGFWNPYGMCVDGAGNVWAVDNDPGGAPPCRLLHIVEGGDYGYEYRYGRSGQHRFVTWNGHLPGTLPMAAGTGEAPCEVMAYRANGLPTEYRDQLLVASWGNNSLERYRIVPHGASFKSTAQTLVQGGENFRPVGIATAPDGSLFISDWTKRDYELHGHGRVWRLSLKDPDARPKTPSTAPVNPNASRLRFAQSLRNGETKQDAQRNIDHLTHDDPFIRNAAITGLARNVHRLTLEDFKSQADAGKRVGMLIAFKRSGEKRFVDALPTFLSDADEDVRFNAIKWVSDDKLAGHRTRLEKMLDSQSVTPRLLGAALAAIDRIDGRKPLDFANENVLFAKVRDDNAPPAIRAMCLQLIRASHPSLNERLLKRLLAVGDERLTHEVLRAAPGLDRPERGALLAEVAQDANQPIAQRATAVTGLGWFAATKAEHRDLLVTLATGAEPTLRDEALSALVGATLTDDDRSRLGAITGADEHTREAIARLLGQPRTTRPDKTDTDAWAKLIDAEPGDPVAGRRVYAGAAVGMCVRCHVAEGRGVRVGPNLTSVRGMSRERLLQSLLEPAREIAPEYIPHAMTLKDGSTRVGLFLTTGGGNGKQGYLGLDGLPFSVFTKDLVSEQTLPTSLMPEGLAQSMTLRELRDLLAYLERLK
jgi:putative membrane-bound dehydrogenase-like protein